METPTAVSFKCPSVLHRVVVLSISQTHCSPHATYVPHCPRPKWQKLKPSSFLGSLWKSQKWAVSHRMPTSVPVTDCPQSVVTVRTSCSSHAGHVVPPLLPPRVGQGHTPPLGTTAIGLPPSSNCSPAPISTFFWGGGAALAAVSGL